jgi:hypothetical protein
MRPLLVMILAIAITSAMAARGLARFSSLALFTLLQVF